MSVKTDRLLLRAIGLDDRTAVFENYSDPDVSRWFFDQPYRQIEQTDGIIQQFMRRAEEGSGLGWSIILEASGEIMGTCSYSISTEN